MIKKLVAMSFELRKIGPKCNQNPRKGTIEVPKDGTTDFYPLERKLFKMKLVWTTISSISVANPQLLLDDT